MDREAGSPAGFIVVFSANFIKSLYEANFNKKMGFFQALDYAKILNFNFKSPPSPPSPAQRFLSAIHRADDALM